MPVDSQLIENELAVRETMMLENVKRGRSNATCLSSSDRPDWGIGPGRSVRNGTTRYGLHP